MARLLRRFCRRLARFPRLVSYERYWQLSTQLPSEQRARAKLRTAFVRLHARYLVERQRHRVKVGDCESLKALLAPDVLKQWRRERELACAETPEAKLWAILRPRLEAMSDEELDAALVAGAKIIAESKAKLAAPSTVGRAHSSGEARDPQGASGPKA